MIAAVTWGLFGVGYYPTGSMRWYCHVWRLRRALAPVLSGCVLWCCCPSQSSLMRAEKQQKQMELPVGLWEDSGRARAMVAGGSLCHVVVCLLCPLVISASPAWWSSRRALACQLNMGPESTLKVHPSPRASLLLPSSIFSPLSSYHSAANTLPCNPLCSWLLTQGDSQCRIH